MKCHKGVFGSVCTAHSDFIFSTTLETAVLTTTVFKMQAAGSVRYWYMTVKMWHWGLTTFLSELFEKWNQVDFKYRKTRICSHEVDIPLQTSILPSIKQHVVNLRHYISFVVYSFCLIIFIAIFLKASGHLQIKAVMMEMTIIIIIMFQFYFNFNKSQTYCSGFLMCLL